MFTQQAVSNPTPRDNVVLSRMELFAQLNWKNVRLDIVELGEGSWLCSATLRKTNQLILNWMYDTLRQQYVEIPYYMEPN